MHPKAPVYSAGFTLTELAIVLVIVALLTGGLVLSLTTTRDIASEKETQKQLSTITEAFSASPSRSSACPVRPPPMPPASRIRPAAPAPTPTTDSSPASPSDWRRLTPRATSSTPGAIASVMPSRPPTPMPSPLRAASRLHGAAALPLICVSATRLRESQAATVPPMLPSPTPPLPSSSPPALSPTEIF